MSLKDLETRKKYYDYYLPKKLTTLDVSGCDIFECEFVGMPELISLDLGDTERGSIVLPDYIGVLSVWKRDDKPSALRTTVSNTNQLKELKTLHIDKINPQDPRIQTLKGKGIQIIAWMEADIYSSDDE